MRPSRPAAAPDPSASWSCRPSSVGLRPRPSRAPHLPRSSSASHDWNGSLSLWLGYTGMCQSPTNSERRDIRFSRFREIRPTPSSEESGSHRADRSSAKGHRPRSGRGRPGGRRRGPVDRLALQRPARKRTRGTLSAGLGLATTSSQRDFSALRAQSRAPPRRHGASVDGELADPALPVTVVAAAPVIGDHRFREAPTQPPLRHSLPPTRVESVVRRALGGEAPRPPGLPYAPSTSRRARQGAAEAPPGASRRGQGRGSRRSLPTTPRSPRRSPRGPPAPPPSPGCAAP